jgi:hypothetical protein
VPDQNPYQPPKHGASNAAANDRDPPGMRLGTMVAVAGTAFIALILMAMVVLVLLLG